MEFQEFQSRAHAKLAASPSTLAPLFCAIARLERFRSFAIRAVCRLEGGQMWSKTFRKLMLNYFEVDIGIHSYGPCLWPEMLPAGTKVGNYCSFAAGIQVFRRNHPMDRMSQHPFFFNAAVGLLDQDTIEAIRENPLTIGHDVWIGQNVIIAPGCRKIGNGAMIASGAVVTSDVAPFAIVGGVPAKLIRWRFNDEIKASWLQSRWFLKPINELGEEIGKFVRPVTLEDFAGCNVNADSGRPVLEKVLQSNQK